MAYNGQASGDFVEGSAALRALYGNTQNSMSSLTTDGFTQANPPIISTNVSTQLSVLGKTRTFGVLSGSVAFTRPDAGNNFVGGPLLSGTAAVARRIRPVGVFVNSAAGNNSYENLPAVASGIAPYFSGQGTFGNRLFETHVLVTVGGVAAGTALTYTVGDELCASQNGYLMPTMQGTTVITSNNALEGSGINNAPSVTIMGMLKHAPDSTLNEIVYDQRI